MKRFFKIKYLLFLIVIIGALFRLYDLNWDQGYHLHPDERAIVMFTTPLQLPKSFSEFLSPQSPWNPHFFAYGSFPIYLLKAAGSAAATLNSQYATYDQINIVGRAISAFFDLGTLIVLFFLGKKIFNKKVGILSSFFYSASVLPIQLSHFYAVDTILSFFILMTLYQLVSLYEKPSFKKSLLVGIFFGLSIATKISAIVLLSSIGIAIAVDFLLIFIKQPHKPREWFPNIPKFLKRLFTNGTALIATAFLVFAICEPYALIDFKNFWDQNMQQYQMTHNAFTFPYALQYVGIIPYWYELKNIFLWGLGPVLATLAFIGTVYVTIKYVLRSFISKSDKELTIQQFNNSTILILVFFWIYFAIVGHFAIGFMRYMLPIYPLLCLFAAVFVLRLFTAVQGKTKNFFIRNTTYFMLYTLLLVWPLSFMHIYTQPNTRVLASNWINQHIPPGKTLALEHWDDGLPMYGGEKYHILTLPLYDPDTTEKWMSIYSQLSQTDYIIIASNRLYVPLMKLTDCKNLPPDRCYLQTTQYYKMLFSGSLGFKKVAEFSVNPTIPFFNIPINDQGADESFTVYDHPKVMIFKRD